MKPIIAIALAGAMLAAAGAVMILAVAPASAQTEVTISGTEDWGVPCPDTGTTFPVGWNVCDIEVDGIPESIEVEGEEVTGANRIAIEVIQVVEGGEDTTTTVWCSATWRSCHYGGRVVANLNWDYDADSRGTTGHWDIWINLDVLQAVDVDKFKVTAGSAVFERNVPLPACDTDETPGVDDCATPTPAHVITPPPTPPTPEPVVCTNCDVDTNGDGVNDAISHFLPIDHPNYAPHLPEDGGLCLDANGNYVDMNAGTWKDGIVGGTWVNAGNTCD